LTLLEGFLWLALNVYHEGRSESQIGQIAIAHVTLNRAQQQDISIKEVIKQPHQFQWVRGKKIHFPHNLPVFLQCMRSAFIALNTRDFTAGATHFHVKSISPDWSSHLTYLNQYGSHKFYR